MAIIGYDGLDNYNSLSDMQARNGKLQWTNCGTYYGPWVTGRGGYGKAMGGFSTATANFSAPTQKITAGFAFDFGANAATLVAGLYDNLTGTLQCTWTFNSSNGSIYFTDSTGAVVASALNALSANGWYYYEIQNGIGPGSGSGAGTAALRVNGQPISSFPDITGVNTQKSANASMSAIAFSGPGGSTSFDDTYFCDGTTGPGTYPCNSFLGDIRNSTQFAVGNGGTIDWTPLANTNWHEISETAMDSDVSYNRSNSAGAIDLFNPAVLGADIDQVICLCVTIAVRLEDAGARFIAPCIQLGATVYVGTPQAVDLSYIYLTSYWPINPSTGASWTTTEVNDCQFGYKIVS